MSDWIGLIFFVLILVAGFFGLSRLSAPPPRISQEEFERRVHDGRGAMSAGVMAGMHALQKLMNPKAAEAVEVERDLKAGHYADRQQQGDGHDSKEGDSV
jgi:hypothetical protein